jgi:hypothetical protein
VRSTMPSTLLYHYHSWFKPAFLYLKTDINFKDIS